MRPQSVASPASPLMWFAIGGAPLAWVVQIGLGYWVTQSQCSANGSGLGISFDALSILVTAVAGLVAMAAGAAAIALLRLTRDAEEDDAPPEGRVHFLSVVGLTVTVLFLCLIVMTGVGTVLLPVCAQS
jgi:hypothetical protein